MNLQHFLDSIYLGDRLCLGLMIEGVGRRVSFKIDNISRVRGDSWDYYAEEDVKDGFLVFEGVEGLNIKSQEVLPNDWIEVVSAVLKDEAKNVWEIVISLGFVNADGVSNEIVVDILASKVFIQTKAGEIIVE